MLLSGRTNYHIFKPVSGLQIYSRGEYRNSRNKEMNNRKENANIMTTVLQEYNTPTIPKYLQHGHAILCLKSRQDKTHCRSVC